MDKSVFTYARASDPLWKRVAINCLEVATGRNTIRRLYFEQQARGWQGSFFATAIRALSLDVRFDAQRLADIPKQGPLIVVANHPFGVLDGIIMCALMAQAREDFLVLTNAVLMKAPEMRARMLPIDFAETRDAQRLNAQSRARAIEHVKQGGCVVIFPGSAVSTSPDWLGRQPAVDPPWTPFLGRLVQQTNADVVPVFFEGQNSTLFQIISHLSQTARLALFFYEVRRRIATQFHVVIGQVIPHSCLNQFADRHALTEHLRKSVYTQRVE